MDTEYSKYLDIYLKEKSLFMSGKKKYKKCDDCSTDKKFIEKDNKLLYSCGSESGKCSDQIIIKLPEYINYNIEKERLNNIIHGSFNYHKEDILSSYNLKKLEKSLNIKELKEKKEQEIKEATEELDNLNSLYLKENELTKRAEEVQLIHKMKIKGEIRKKDILYELRQRTTTDEKKIELRKEYAKIIYENNQNIYPLIEHLETPLNYILSTKKYEIKVSNDELEEKAKEKVKKEKVKKEKDNEIKDIDLYVGNKGYELCKELSETKLSQKEIDEKRQKIYNEIIKEVKDEITEDNYKKLLKDTEMKLIFYLYDKYFFNNKLTNLSKENDCQWIICWNNRCSKTAGRQKCNTKGKCKIIEIELSSKVFENTIRKMKSEGLEYIKMDDKIKCDSILSCLQLVFEHELVHALQDCFCQNWMYKKGPGDWPGKTGPGSGHSKTFMSILNNTFGHIDFRHQLFSSSEKKIIKDSEDLNRLGDKQEEMELEIAKEISKKSDKKFDKLKKTKSKEETKKNMEPIKYFSRSKENKWLSAFNKGKEFTYKGYTYPTVEHAFHAQKIDPKDSQLDAYKTKLSDKDLKPSEAKKIGGKRSFKENNYKFRNDWDKIKLKLMKEITEEYYKENPKFLTKLKETGNKELLHTGPRIDKFWGITKDGGENHHGKILMEIRDNMILPKKLTKEGKKWAKEASKLMGKMEK